MTTLLLIRHGQSCANKAQLFIGQTDSPLSELGLIQAERTADYVVANYAVDKVYSSDLRRAYQTGKAVADRLGLEIVTDRELRELNCGIWEGVVFNDMYNKGEQFFLDWEKNIGRIVCPEGESIAQLQERAAKALLRIAAENDGKTVVVAVHATLIRAVQCLFEGKDLDEMKYVPWVTNASVSVFNYADGKMSVVSAGYNEHLKDIQAEVTAMESAVEKE